MFHTWPLNRLLWLKLLVRFTTSFVPRGPEPPAPSVPTCLNRIYFCPSNLFFTLDPNPPQLIYRSRASKKKTSCDRCYDFTLMVDLASEKHSLGFAFYVRIILASRFYVRVVLASRFYIYDNLLSGKRSLASRFDVRKKRIALASLSTHASENAVGWMRGITQTSRNLVFPLCYIRGRYRKIR